MNIDFERGTNSWLLLLPAAAASAITYVGILEGSNSALVAIVGAMVVLSLFYVLWRGVLTKLVVDDGELRIERNGSAVVIGASDIRRTFLIEIRPAYTIVLIVWRHTCFLPTMAWSGFMESSVGNFSKTIVQMKEILRFK